MCEDVQLKDEHMSHSFGNNVEIRHRSLGAVAEFEQSGGDRSPRVANLASFDLSVHLINLRSGVLGKNLRDSGDELGPNRERPKLHTSPAFVLVSCSFKPRPPVDTF